MEDKKLYPDVVNQPTAWETKSNYFPRGINIPFIGDTEEGTWHSDTRPRYQPPRQKIIFQEPPKPPKPPVKESKVIQQKPVVKPEVIQPTPTPQPIPTPTPIIVNPELQKFVEERRPEPPGPPPGIGTDVMPVYDIDELPMYATPDPDAEIVTDTKRYIDWNGNSVGYRLPRFRQPGHGGPLIKAGKKHYFHYPSIETRNQIQIIPEEEYSMGGEYLELDLTPEQIQEYAKGGYVIEELDGYAEGGDPGKPDPKTQFYTVQGSDGVYRKVNGKWEVDWNRSGSFQPLSKGDVKKRTAVLNSQAKPLYDQAYDDLYTTQRQPFTPKPVNKPTPAKSTGKIESFDNSIYNADETSDGKPVNYVDKNDPSKFYVIWGDFVTQPGRPGGSIIEDKNEIANIKKNIRVATQFDLDRLPANQIYSSPEELEYIRRAASGEDPYAVRAELKNKETVNNNQIFFDNAFELKEEDPNKWDPRQKNIMEEQDVKGQQFIKDWQDSPMYWKMLSNSLPSDQAQYMPFYASGRDNQLSILNPIFMNEAYKPGEWSKSTGLTAAATSVGRGQVNIYPKTYSDIPQFSLPTHEYSHVADNNGRLIPQKDIDLMRSFVGDPMERKRQFFNYDYDTSDEGRQKIKAQYDYISDPTETRARLNELRFLGKESGLYDPFTQKVTPEIFKQFNNIESYPGGNQPLEDLRDVYTDEQILEMLNTISKNNESDEELKVAAKGGEYVELDLTPEEIQQYAKGGYVIEDISVPELTKANLGKIVPKAGQLARTGIYKGLNPAGYGILDKVKGVPSELFNTAVNNSTRPFRVGMSLKYGHPEMLETFLKTKRVPLEDFKKMSDADKMQLFDSTTLHTLDDIGRRRLDAWAVGLGLPQEYSTLEQIGDDKFRMLNTEYTPEYFNELYNDLRASGYENTLTAGYNPLEGLSREFYRTKLQNRLATQKDIDAEMTLQDQMRMFGWNAWDRSRNAKLNPASFSGIDTGSVWDNDPYGVMGGFRWDIDQHPQGLQFTTSDVWDLNPFEKRGSAFLNPSDLSKKSLAASYFKPLQNLEALKLVGGKPFLIENNFVIDPKTYNTLDKWEDGGNMDYTLGDEVDEATMKELEKLGYTFEKI